MAPPVASFTLIPLADVDPDSPVTTDLMNALRLNDQNLFAQLVGEPVAAPPFTAAAAHDHDGVNSALVSVFDLSVKEAIDNTTRTRAISGFVDIAGATITYVAAELTANREVMVILTGTWAIITASLGDMSIRIVVDGVAGETIELDFDGAEGKVPIAFSKLVTLNSGADRTVKFQFASSGSGTLEITHTYMQTFFVG